jgi:hypothetical protein
VHPAPRRRPMPGSGPRRHDTRDHLIAPRACRETSIPASHHYCPGASKAARDTGDDAKIAPSTAAAATNFLPQSAIRRRIPRPAQPRPKTLPRQISIDARLLTQPPRVPSWEAFGSRPVSSVGKVAIGRHPKPCTDSAIRSGRPERRVCARLPPFVGPRSNRGSRPEGDLQGRPCVQAGSARKRSSTEGVGCAKSGCPRLAANESVRTKTPRHCALPPRRWTRVRQPITLHILVE